MFLAVAGIGTWASAIVLVSAIALVTQILLPLVIFKKVLRARDTSSRV